MVVEKGRVCMKIAGREAGKKCVIVEVVDENFVVIAGDGLKKRKCNIKHLEFLSEKIEIKNESNEDEQSKEQPKKRTAKKRADSKK